MQNKSRLMFSALVALATTSLMSPALSTPGSGFTPNAVVNGHFGTLNVNTADKKTEKWGMHLKTLSEPTWV